MCIICISPSGAPQPTEKQLRTMFANNPDGAGYMYARDGKVTIHKAFCNIDDLIHQLNRERFTADDVVVYHFRISTQAPDPTMTHPFPLTNKLEMCEQLDLTAPVGIAHNGVIHMTSNGNTRYSDTALFITQYMTRIIRSRKDLTDPRILDILWHLTYSKLAILDGSGYVATVGNFIKDQSGLLFSNTSYLPRTTFTTVKRRL